MSITRRITVLHSSAADILNYLQSPLLLAVRLYWGWQFAQSGWGRLHNLDRATEFFASLNLPQPHLTVIVVSLAEFIGGILLALGLASRVTSLILFVDMTVAYWTSDREALGHIFNDPGKFYVADPYTFWFATLLILIFGPGYLALDTFLARKYGLEALE
jgi:putative oxidoreductase